MSSPWAKYARKPSRGGPTACLLPAIGCLLLAGCNNSRQLQSDLYQRELRLQEDEIYRLEDYVTEYQEIIQGYRCELADMRRRLAENAPGERIEAGRRTIETLPEPTPALPEAPEALDLDGPEGVDVTDDLMPDIEVPDPSINTPTPASATDPTEPAPRFNGSAYADPSNHSMRLARLDADPREPATLRTASVSSGTYDSDSPPAPYPHAAIEKPIAPPKGLDPTIRLRVEPGPGATMNAIVATIDRNSLLDFDGEASVMLTDPSIEGGRRRIARWDFTAIEVADAWKQSEAGRSLELPIALPDAAPADTPLRLWVRLIDASGAKRLQSVPLQLTGDPPRLEVVTTLSSDARPRRLPAIDRSKAEKEPARLAINETEAKPIDSWRPARQTPRDRTIDPALLPASFESE